MIIYGSQIISDTPFPLKLPNHGPRLHDVVLSSQVPTNLKKSITCGFPLYMAHGRKVHLLSDRIFDGTENGQPWCYSIENLLSFYWKGGGHEIYYEFTQKVNTQLLSFWFIHLLLPLYFTLENKYDFLHAGAVEIGGHPVLFIAPSMGGKSTLTEYFINKGHGLVSDDKVATFIQNNQCMAVSSHPYHRPYRKFEDLGLYSKHFKPSCKPIKAFYSLNRADEADTVTIDEVNGSKKFETLLPSYLYMFHFLMAKRLQYLALILNNIKVFSVQIPWNLDMQEKVYQKIKSHSNTIS